jgi:hypothetical protein
MIDFDESTEFSAGWKHFGTRSQKYELWQGYERQN